jgi:hypothetical protein
VQNSTGPSVICETCITSLLKTLSDRSITAFASVRLSHRMGWAKVIWNSKALKSAR